MIYPCMQFRRTNQSARKKIFKRKIDAPRKHVCQRITRKRNLLPPLFASIPPLSPYFFQQTEISVQFKALSGHNTYELQWKEIQAPWDAAGTGSVPAAASGKTQAVATNLNPGTSYCIRLVVAGSTKGSPGPEMIIDTEQIGCTPKQKKGCVIL